MLRRLRDERGIALVMALGIMVALSITVIALLDYTSSNARSTRFDTAEQKVVALAESGLNEVAAIIGGASKPGHPSALPPGGATLEDGTVTWSGTLYGDIWTVTVNASRKNPSGAADLTQQARAKLRVIVDPNGANQAWNYLYSDSLTSCMQVENTVTVTASIFARGDLCQKGNSQINSPVVTVGGKLTVENPAAVGSAGSPITALHVGTGCAPTAGGPWNLANCTGSNRIWASTVDSNAGSITKPPVDLDLWYNDAAPGPKASCTTGSFPGGFDNNSALDRSLGTVYLMPNSSYSCTVTSGSSTLGKIAWTPGTPGTLEIMGVIFFDGDVQAGPGGGNQAVYTGRGAIYASGKIQIDNQNEICGAASCDSASWDPNTNMLVFVAGTSTDAVGFHVKNQGKFQGAVYAVNDVKEEDTGMIEAPMIARLLELKNSASGRQWPPVETLVYGTPTTNNPPVKVVLVPGSWET